jgi:LuxR family maltose regulon positive regulatory protein
MAVSLYEQNRVPEARELCDALIQQVDSACSTEIVFNVYVTLARLQYIAGHHARGVQLLLQLRRILRQGRYRRLLNQLLAEELAHALRSGQAATIKGIAEEYDLAALLASEDWEAPPRQFREARVYGGIAIALYLRSRRQYDRAQAVLQALGELFARVGLQCAIRTVFDEAPGFGGLVRLAHEKALIALPEIYLQLYANVLYPPVAEAAGSGPEPLTAKEQEVLELVRQGLANKEISRELNISLSTTKWHLKNIFAKLQVSNRTSAMAVLARSESGHRKTG